MQFAFFCPPFAGHVNPMLALASALRARGHGVTFIGPADVAPAVRAAGVRAQVVGLASHPPGTVAALEGRLAALHGLWGIGPVIRDVAAMTDMLCREAPSVLERLQPDGIVSDQLEPAGGLLARRFRLPLVTVANALMLDREAYVPPPFTDWPYARTPWARERNLGGYRVSDWMMAPVARVIARWSAAFGLAPRTRAEQCVSERQVGQLSAALDFPREQLSPGFHYAGPLRPPPEEEPPWAPPAGHAGPFAFVSLGSLQGGRFGLLARITRACRELGLTPIVAHNGRLGERQAAALPGRPIVERFVPQRRVIARCDVVVTHGGMNTVLDGLSAGVPLVLVPLAMEQGAIAQRVARAGAGRWLPARRAGVSALRRLIDGTLATAQARDAAKSVAATLSAGGGAQRAAELIEQHAVA